VYSPLRRFTYIAFLALMPTLLGSRIALMDKGRIALLATPDEFKRSELPLVRAYLETAFVTV